MALAQKKIVIDEEDMSSAARSYIGDDIISIFDGFLYLFMSCHCCSCIVCEIIAQKQNGRKMERFADLLTSKKVIFHQQIMAPAGGADASCVYHRGKNPEER